jgi:hypothetical protein
LSPDLANHGIQRDCPEGRKGVLIRRCHYKLYLLPKEGVKRFRGPRPLAAGSLTESTMGSKGWRAHFSLGIFLQAHQRTDGIQCRTDQSARCCRGEKGESAVSPLGHLWVSRCGDISSLPFFKGIFKVTSCGRELPWLMWKGQTERQQGENGV